MNKLRKILAFIRALLGFLLNFKKKRPDGKEEENEPVPPASGGQEMFPAIVQPALPSLVPDGIGPAGFVGGPFGGVLGCLGALLTLSGYGDTERDMTGSGNKTATPRRCRLGVADVCCGLLFLLA